MEKLVIIGSGPAGYTAAIYAARANLNPLILAGALPGGLLTQTTDVENFPGFPNAVNGFELVYSMQQQAEKFGARIEMVSAERVEFVDNGVQKIYIEGNELIEAQAVIIATGAQPRWLNLESETRLKNHGVSACATCDGAFFKGKKVAVIGGGDSAMEEALFLTKFVEKVTVVHRRDTLSASKIMIERAMRNPKIEFMWNSEVAEILGDSVVTGAKINNILTNETSILECSGIFVALGHQPATGIFKDFIEIDERGFIRLTSHTSHTTISGVFAAGDCADPHYRQAIYAAGMGCAAAMDAEEYLALN